MFPVGLGSINLESTRVGMAMHGQHVAAIQANGKDKECAHRMNGIPLEGKTSHNAWLKVTWLVNKQGHPPRSPRGQLNRIKQGLQVID